jgi:hypothetical protein
LCDFSIREPNHPKESHRYTVQCVLPFNLFNQQIFTYLYFWLVILSCFNFASIVIWLYRMSPYNYFHYLERRLTSHFFTDEDKNEKELKRKFVYQYLQGDGTFMLRLVASNVSDYVCTKMILELYNTFHASLPTGHIGRDPLFKRISISKSDNDIEQDDNTNQNDDDDGSTDQTVAADIPPIPNPRHGKIFIERDALSNLPSDISDSEHSELQQIDLLPVPTSTVSGQVRLRSSMIPLLKDIRRSSEIQMGSSERTTPRFKSVEFHLEPNIILSSGTLSPFLPPPPPPPLSAMKGPSPYATTYLTSKKPNEHELPYIDDSNSGGSTTGRLTSSTTVVQQSEKPSTTLASTNLFFRRSHDV